MVGYGKWRRASTGVAVGAVLVGCWKEPTASLRQQQGTYSDQVVATELREMASLHGLALPGDIASLALPSLLRTAFLACQPTLSGSDALNAAGIARDQRRTYLCETTSPGPTSRRGSIHVQAIGEAYAARITYDGLRSIIILPTGGVESRLDGIVEVRAIDERTLEIREGATEVFDSPAGILTRIRDLVRTVSDTVALQPGRFPLTPPTSVVIEGTMRMAYSRAPHDTLQLEISTPRVLKPDRNCTLQGGFRDGQIRAVRRTGPPGVVNISFGC